MNRKKTIARIAAGFLSVVTFLSAVTGPLPAMAADPDADSGYMEDYPELKDVRDILDEDEIVKAEDITVDADEDFEIEKDFKGIDYSSKKVKISLYDDDGFSSSASSAPSSFSGEFSPRPSKPEPAPFAAPEEMASFFSSFFTTVILRLKRYP